MSEYEKASELTLCIGMKPNCPLSLKTFVDILSAQYRLLNEVDKSVSGKKRPTLDWYIAGLSVDADNVSVTLAPAPKGAGVRIREKVTE